MSEIFDVKRSTFGSWKSRNRIPYEQCLNVSIDKKVDLVWLLTGQGAMYSNPADKLNEAPTVYYPAAKDIKKNWRKSRLEAFIDAFFEDSTEDDDIWLEGQIKRAVPDFDKFLSNKSIEQKSQKKQAG